MGIHPNLRADKYPEQGPYENAVVTVVFNFGNEDFIGVIVRDDYEDPFETIIMLEDGRVVRAYECQYSPHNYCKVKHE